MRSVLITTAGLALLLASTLAQASDDRERRGNDVNKGMDQVTICEVFASVHKSDLTLVEDLKIQRGGLDPDITIGRHGIDLCAALVQKEAPKLCKKHNRNGRSAPLFNFGYSFKIVQVNLNPPPPTCNGPSDPQCVDFLFDSFILTSIAADVQSGDCAQIMDR
jgi:hypothetical protein